jgi:hypothetical protein
MKMTHSIQAPFSFSSSIATPQPPRFEGSADTTPRPASETSHGIGRFDIRDAEGYMPEIICRIMLGFCLAFSFVECLIRLAS